mmetsp:Transcript_22617/g.51665  ORF Transcript_22617/g.51665 Transcript_22617/m.51665 type:complete len:137 (-) Transcript_22617:52-462(-)
MQAAGAKRVVALVKEDVGTEIAQFKEFWPGEVLVDSTMAFYAALGGGRHHKPYGGTASFMAEFLNPFAHTRTKDALKRTKDIKANMAGEKWTAGGSYVIAPDGNAVFSFLEEQFGDHAPLDEMVRAVAEAAGGGKS